MQEKLAQELGLVNLPNYWDKRYIKNLDELSRPKYGIKEMRDVWAKNNLRRLRDSA